MVGNIKGTCPDFQGAEWPSGKLTQYCEIVRKCFLRDQVVYSLAGTQSNHIRHARLAHKCMWSICAMTGSWSARTGVSDWTPPRKCWEAYCAVNDKCLVDMSPHKVISMFHQHDNSFGEQAYLPYLDLAPGTRVWFVKAGFACRQRTASV